MAMEPSKEPELSLNKESIRRLDHQELTESAGGAGPGVGPLTFTVACPTSNCQTLGEFCPTHDCMLTFGWC